MAKIGLKYPVFSPLTEGGGVATYGTGFVIGKAISASTSIEVSDEKLYGDDDVAESVKEFSGGTITLNSTHIAQEHKAVMLGHVLQAAGIAGDDVKMLVSHGDDDGAYGGFGFYGRETVNGVKSWHAYWFPKVKFAEPNDELETKGETTAFVTPTIEGEIFRDADGNWKKDVVVSTEAKAIEWLDALANIGEPADLTALNAAILAAEALLPDDYTSASWVAVANALTAANAIKLQSGIGQNAVDAATLALTSAVEDLIPEA